MSLVLISRYDYPYEAHLAKGVLEQEGISAFISDEYHVGVYWVYAIALGGVKLWVDKSCVKDAQAVLSKDYTNELLDHCCEDKQTLTNQSEIDFAQRKKRKSRWAILLICFFMV